MWTLPHGPLHADLYAYTMALAHFRAGTHNTPTTYHAFARKCPFGGSFMLAAGLADALKWLEDFKFSDYRTDYLASIRTSQGNRLFDDHFLRMVQTEPFSLTIDALPEGSLAFANIPFARTFGPQWQNLAIEGGLLGIINGPSLIATEAARCVLAAQGDPVFDASLRRALDQGAYVSARSSFIGGFVGTSNVAAGYALGIPTKGTFAHAFVMFHNTEEEAFRTYIRHMDDVVVLLDTYNTIAAVKKAIRICKEENKKLLAVRLDSGDLGWLSVQVRNILNDAGFNSTIIMASNELDPRAIASLKAQQARGEAAIDSWQVGTDVGAPKDQSALGGVFKLADVDGRNVIKVAERGTSATDVKTSISGPQGTLRFLNDSGTMYDSDTILPLEMQQRLAGLTGPSNDPQQVFYLPKDLVSVDMADPERPKRFRKGQAFTIPHIRVVDNGKILPHETSLQAIQDNARRNLAMLNPTHLRLDSPHRYVAGLEDSLFETRRRMIREIHLENA